MNLKDVECKKGHDAFHDSVSVTWVDKTRKRKKKLTKWPKWHRMRCLGHFCRRHRQCGGERWWVLVSVCYTGGVQCSLLWFSVWCSIASKNVSN